MHRSLVLIFDSQKHYVLYHRLDCATGGVTGLCSCHVYYFFSSYPDIVSGALYRYTIVTFDCTIILLDIISKSSNIVILLPVVETFHYLVEIVVGLVKSYEGEVRSDIRRAFVSICEDGVLCS